MSKAARTLGNTKQSISIPAKKSGIKTLWVTGFTAICTILIILLMLL